jgi:hypothetical protein
MIAGYKRMTDSDMRQEVRQTDETVARRAG